MSWAGSSLGTDQPDWLARVELPPIILVLAGWRSGDALRTRDGSWRSGPPGLVAGSGGLCGPAVWLDPVPTQQRPQPFDLTVQALVLLDDRGKVHRGRPCLLPLGHPLKQLPLLVAQRRRPLEVLGIDRGLLLPPHPGELLLSLAKIVGHAHAYQPRPRSCLHAGGSGAGQHLDDLLANPVQPGAQLDQHLGAHPSPSWSSPSRMCSVPM